MNASSLTIDTNELRRRIGKPGFKIIDARTVEAYNGWKLRHEPREGHIRTAKSLPAKWCSYMDWNEIIESKEIGKADDLVIYGYDDTDSDPVVSNFLRAGYPRVSVYRDFLSKWNPDSELPMERLDRYQSLVSAPWLRDLITLGRAPSCDPLRWVLCHAFYHDRRFYENGHIPGALPLDTNTLESPETWNRRSPEELKKTLEALGITYDTTVILYGKFAFPDNRDPFPGAAAGDLAALRCAFIMMYAGIKDVRILNGGFQSWLDAGFEVSLDETQAVPVADFGTGIPASPHLAVDLPEAREILRSSQANLVCVRSWPEYTGEVSGYHYIEQKGHIPGAVFSHCGSDAYHMENFRNQDQTTRDYHEIETNWRRSGITPDKWNAFYCGTGWRASEAFFNAWLMGWPKISVYDGGWFEWSRDKNNPIETGIPDLPAAARETGGEKEVITAKIPEKKVRIEDHLPHEDRAKKIRSALAGLLTLPRSIPSILFYDKTGSRLFEEITRLQEYYPSRLEKELLSKHAETIARDLGETDIVELGSGDSSKITILLEAVPSFRRSSLRYIPVDISRSAVRGSAADLVRRFPELSIHGHVADFTKQITGLSNERPGLFCFFGSTLGNFTRPDMTHFFRMISRVMKPGDHFLLGADRLKPKAVLERAYNDSRGVTRRFNLNILRVLNAVAKTNFEPRAFEHLAFYHEKERRIEMHLRATRRMRISSCHLDRELVIEKNETIHTEDSHKFTIPEIENLAEGAGLNVGAVFSAPDEWFSLVRMTKP